VLSLSGSCSTSVAFAVWLRAARLDVSLSHTYGSRLPKCLRARAPVISAMIEMRFMIYSFVYQLFTVLTCS
jgi:hypothetical protein